MRAGIDIRIRANRNPGTLVQLARNAVDQFQFGRRLDIIEENPGVERITDLISGFADSRKDHLIGGTSRAQDAKQFTA